MVGIWAFGSYVKLKNDLREARTALIQKERERMGADKAKEDIMMRVFDAAMAGTRRQVSLPVQEDRSVHFEIAPEYPKGHEPGYTGEEPESEIGYPKPHKTPSPTLSKRAKRGYFFRGSGKYY